MQKSQAVPLVLNSRIVSTSTQVHRNQQHFGKKSQPSEHGINYPGDADLKTQGESRSVRPKGVMTPEDTSWRIAQRSPRGARRCPRDRTLCLVTLVFLLPSGPGDTARSNASVSWEALSQFATAFSCSAAGDRQHRAAPAAGRAGRLIQALPREKRTESQGGWRRLPAGDPDVLALPPAVGCPRQNISHKAKGDAGNERSEPL